MRDPSGPPSITLSPTGPLTLREGGVLSIECIAEGDPTPTVQWQTPGRQASAVEPLPPHLQNVPGEASALVTISGVTTEDSGTYVCIANNNAGRSEERIIITGQCLLHHNHRCIHLSVTLWLDSSAGQCLTGGGHQVNTSSLQMKAADFM